MADDIFYVAQTNPQTTAIVGYVAAKYLSIDGQLQPQPDPFPKGGQTFNIYSDSTGSNPTDGAVFNPNNYIIVPANYSISQASSFASDVSQTIRLSALIDPTRVTGFA